MCYIYIHETINYDSYTTDNDLELQSVCLYIGNKKLTLINFYNPCKKLNDDSTERIFSYITSENYLWVGAPTIHYGAAKKLMQMAKSSKEH